MKILLTGTSGQVGWELARTLMPLGAVIEINRTQADLTELKKLRAVIAQYKPDVIVNPAAYTAVDKAESEKELAFLVNAEAPAVLAEEAKNTGALFVHYSTDYVFDGTKREAYVEEDITNPINVYGQSKLAGEEAIQRVGEDYLILRTSWVYASRGSNFLKTMLRLAAEREELRIVNDQIGAPTWARLIAEATAHIIRQSLVEKLNNDFNSAIYHLTSASQTSWHGFAKEIISSARQQGFTGLVNQSILPITTKEYPLPAKRPLNSLLSSHKLEQRFGLNMPSWDNSLRLCLQELAG